MAGTNNTEDSFKIQGSLVNEYAKDPSQKELGNNGLIQTLLLGDIKEGPSTDIIDTVGPDGLKVAPDKFGNFLHDPNTSPRRFDTTIAFAYVHRTHNFYRRVLHSMGVQEVFNWQWSNESPDTKITVVAHAGNWENAFYDRASKSIKFFEFRAPDGSMVFTCRAEGVVAHETGHAVLDTLKPGFLESYLPQTGALHEAFGDISALFVLMDNTQICSYIINQSKGDLLNKEMFLPQLAKQFGDAIGEHYGLRNAVNNLTVEDAGNEAHALSRVFTGAIYNIIAARFQHNWKNQGNNKDPELILKDTSFEVATLLVKSLKAAPKSNASFGNVAYHMHALGDANMRAIVAKEFAARKVELSYYPVEPSVAELLKFKEFDFAPNREDRTRSATMSRPDVVKARNDAIEAKIAEIKNFDESFSGRFYNTLTFSTPKSTMPGSTVNAADTADNTEKKKPVASPS